MKQSYGKKEERRNALSRLLRENPCLTDGELAERFSVSSATIRLDRQTMKIPQMRERMEQAFTLHPAEHRGELKVLDVDVGEKGVALLQTTAQMTDMSGMVSPEYLYGASTEFAQLIVGIPFAPIQVGNIKYKIPVPPGTQLVVKGKLALMKGNRQYIYICFFREEDEVFRAKFIMDGVSGEMRNDEKNSD